MRKHLQGIVLSIISFILILGIPCHADSSATLDDEPVYWYEGRVKKHAWPALDEAAVFAPKKQVERQNAFLKIKQSLPDVSLIRSSGPVMYLKKQHTQKKQGLNKRIKGISPSQRTSPVFYRSRSGRKETRMVLTGEIIVKFYPDMTREMIESIEIKYGLTRLKSFEFAKNTNLYDAGDPLGSLKCANTLYESHEAEYVCPNWIVACSRRAIPDDPLFSYNPNNDGYQWHLRNTDFEGEDVNITTVWDTYMGSPNEVVAIVDDGVELDHEDLEDNVLPEYCWDFVDADIDPTAGRHGTCCAGVAAGRGFDAPPDAIGICGAAPQTGLVGHRLFNDSWEASFDSIAGSLTRSNQVIDIYSNSWGPNDGGYNLDDMPPLVADAIENGITSGRGDLGSIFIWSAGNGSDTDNSNYDAYANSRYTIAVSASTNQGGQSVYLEKGANILVNAPSSGGTLAITTTDRTGALGENEYGDYYYGFGGTSASTPLVAGIIALMLEANPNLTWRDVQHVLMETAQQNDPADPDWVQNGAGFQINHKYGFGRIDAQAAIDAAETWTSANPEVSTEQTSSPGIAIPDNDPTGVSDTVTIYSNMIIESVEVLFTASDHVFWPDLEITLTSPDGTASILSETHDPTYDPVGLYDNWKFCTLRHYKELSQGDWTLSVKDNKSSHTGTFQSWTLKIYGTYTIAPEYPSVAGNPVIDFAGSTISISFDKPDMMGALAESSYSFSPSLPFRTPGGTDDTEYIGNNTYLLYFSSIPHYIIYEMTMATITDSNAHHLINDTVTLNDNDNNEMADDWEDHYNVESPNEDLDNDGLTNASEFAAGTYPDDSDSDNDSLPDGWEYDTGLDPADDTEENGTNGDFDNDGWSNYEEYVNNTDPANDSSPEPAPPEVKEAHPHDNAGIDDDTRIPVNTSFAVRIEDEEGIDITDETSIVFTIDDGVNPVYEAGIDDEEVVRIVKLTADPDTGVKNLWAAYDRSLEDALGDYPYDAMVIISLDVKDKRQDYIDPAIYGFAVETEQEHDDAMANLEPYNTIFQGDPLLGGIYDTGIRITGSSLYNAAIVYNSVDPVPPQFGPAYEIPSFDINGVNAIGEPINLQPPTIYNIPPRVLIPCPGYADTSSLNVYGYNGSNWVSICDSSGIVSEEAQGWMVEGSRIDHVDGDPSSIEIKLYHFSGIIAAETTSSQGNFYHSSHDGCFIRSSATR